MKKNNEFINIGKIINTFGIRGELKIYSESDFIEERFSKGKKVYFEIGKTKEVHEVSSFRVHKNNVIITIDNLFDINKIEHYVGCNVYANSEDALEIDEDDYYIDDLVGLDVYNTNDEHLGVVADVLEMPRGYLLEIRDNKNKKILVPFVDAYVKDITDDKIIIEEIEGLR